jgi:cytochrome P450
MNAVPEALEIPQHVPPELVVELPFVRGKTTHEVPHDTVNSLSSGPDLFFAPAWPTPAGSWIIRRAELWRQVVMDTDHITSSDFTPFAKLAGGTWKMIPIEIDPPQHNKYRLVLNPLLSPKAISALDAKIVGYARQDIAAFKDRGRCEFMKEFSFEFPIRIFVELMGWPLADTPRLLAWERGMLYAKSIEEMQEAVLATVDYLKSQIAARRDTLTDDFMSHILRAEIDGRKLDDDELMGILFTLFSGGLDTVSVHLAFMIRHLAEHPEQQAFLRAHPDRIPDAVDELMRLYGVAGSLRTCTKDMEINGVTIKAGDRISASPLMAGRNSTEYTAPLEARFDRAPKHISFGYGPHVCIGMHLARREMRTAIATMLEMLPPFSIAPDEDVVSEMSGMLQPRALPLVWEV